MLPQQSAPITSVFKATCKFPQTGNSLSKALFGLDLVFKSQSEYMKTQGVLT